MYFLLARSTLDWSQFKIFPVTLNLNTLQIYYMTFCPSADIVDF